MEAEQINEWSAKHPGERILDIDIPLSYGVIEPIRDPGRLNVLTFKWDPSRDTGIYIKVNCISTEFTPKKHGGEKGVPFRLQVWNCLSWNTDRVNKGKESWSIAFAPTHPIFGLSQLRFI